VTCCSSWPRRSAARVRRSDRRVLAVSSRRHDHCQRSWHRKVHTEWDTERRTPQRGDEVSKDIRSLALQCAPMPVPRHVRMARRPRPTQTPRPLIALPGISPVSRGTPTGTKRASQAILVRLRSFHPFGIGPSPVCERGDESPDDLYSLGEACSYVQLPQHDGQHTVHHKEDTASYQPSHNPHPSHRRLSRPYCCGRLTPSRQSPRSWPAFPNLTRIHWEQM
jgi:hypothetical protein